MNTEKMLEGGEEEGEEHPIESEKIHKPKLKSDTKIILKILAETFIHDD